MTRLISLGSSFAAGPGIQPQLPPPNPGKRSQNNYAAILAQRLGFAHIDLSYSGSTLSHIHSEGFNGAQPQIDQIPPAPAPGGDGNGNGRTLVTITSGGNDLGYVGRIMVDSLESTWLGWGLGWLVRRGLPDPTLVGPDELVSRFGEVISAVRERLPGCEVILVGYLTLFGDEDPEGSSTAQRGMSAEQVKAHRARAEVLRRAYSRAAEEWGCGFVDVGEKSRGHGAGSPTPWVTGHVGVGGILRGEAPWHPNRKGMEAVAGMIEEYLDQAGVGQGAS